MASLKSLIGVPPSKGKIADSVLIIIDAQNEYAEGKLKIKDVETSRKVIHALLERYRAASAPVIHVIHQVPVGAPIFQGELEDEFDELKSKDEVVVYKQQPGSFFGTNLQEQLDKTGKKQLVLVGYMAHVCVSTTTRQAAERGYDVVIPKDAVGDRDIPGATADELVRVALAELADAFATVVTSDEIE